MSAPGVGEVGLGSGLQQRQGCSQPLKLLLLVIAEFLLFLTLSLAVRRGVVVGALFGLELPPPPRLFLPGFFPFFGRFFCTRLGQSRWKCPYALQRWHWSVLEAAIAAPRPETTGPDAFRDCWST